MMHFTNDLLFSDDMRLGNLNHLSIGGLLLEAKAFYMHLQSRWIYSAKATSKKTPIFEGVFPIGAPGGTWHSLPYKVCRSMDSLNPSTFPRAIVV